MTVLLPTRVPDTIDALVAGLASLDNVTVLDGPVSTMPRKDCVQIGAGEEGVVASTPRSDGLRVRYVETVDIVCHLWSWGGGSAVKPRRDRCLQILADIATYLDSNPTLGDAVDLATLGQDWSWSQQLTAKGAAVSLGFTISTRSHIVPT